ncbi:MAG: hypothetical protein LBP32_04930 [Spirochaetaceae bacterium]|jgi:hypothetical protein|nr:hypothetical protein [Spirochaetaceae bacterium]
MDFQKSTAIAAILSLGAGVLMFLAVREDVSHSGTGYVVFTVDESCSDRAVGDLLREAAIEGHISESTQWVFLDDFGEPRRIPLDEYRNRVEAFDPRNDGYAETLRSFFVRDGARRFYVPFSPGFSGETPGGFKKRLAAALGEIPIRSIAHTGAPRPLFRRLILLAAAVAGTLILSRTRFPLLFPLPPMAALALPGPAGFALAAVLTALFFLLLDPAREFFVPRRDSPSRGIMAPLKLFKPRWVLAAMVLGIYGLICRLGGVPPGPGLGGALSFFLLLGLSLRAESKRGADQGHIRFQPVPIRDHPPAALLSSSAVIPFALASLVSLFPPGPVLGDPPAAPGEKGSLVSPLDYEQHWIYQSSFSLRPLRPGGGRNGGDSFDDAPYLRYFTGEDGLIAGSAEIEEPPRDMPPFPLEDLMKALAGSRPAPAFTPGELIAAVIALGFCFPPFFGGTRGRRKKKKMIVYKDTGIAARTAVNVITSVPARSKKTRDAARPYGRA